MLLKHSPFIPRATKEPILTQKRPGSFYLQGPCIDNVQSRGRRLVPNIAVTRYASKTPDLPPYGHHQRAAANRLVQPDRVLLAMPTIHVYDDEATEDKDFWVELEEQFTQGLPYEFGRSAFIKRLEQCKQLSHAVGTFLQDLGCSMDDVLRLFVKQETQELDIPNVPQAKRLRAQARKENRHLSKDFSEFLGVVEHMNQRSQEVREATVFACTGFQDEMGFSIWPLAEAHAKRLLQTRKESMDLDIPTDLAAHARLVCRVCHV